MLLHHYRELLHFLLRSVKDRDTAADLAQESYARVLSSEQQGGAIRDARALLYRTARNLLIDRHRQAQTQRQQPVEASDHDGVDSLLEQIAAPAAFEPEAALSSQQTVDALLATIDALPLRCRQAFILHKFDGLSHVEVARQMGISVKMVEKHIQNGLWACRDCLEQQDKPPSRS